MSATLISVSPGVLKQYAIASNFGLFKSYMPLSHRRDYSSAKSNPKPFTYRLAAASAGKTTPTRPPKHGRDFWNYASTHPAQHPPYLLSTKRDSGEDAFFAASIGGSKHHVALGVADGVGGWQDSGIDPSHFSHGLCEVMAGSAHTHEGLAQGGKSVRPLDLLQTAYDRVIANPRIFAGGSTASLAVVDGDGGMETANLGDSGFLIISPGKVSHRSNPQTHAFNTPYQLSKVPPKMQAQQAIFGGSVRFSEPPSQADVEKFQLKHGDLVIFATDGVWDNLSAQDSLAIVTRVMEERGYWSKSHGRAGAETLLNATLISDLPSKLDNELNESYLPGLLATSMMREAKAAGLNRRRDGPFAREVKKFYPREAWPGGKADDIAVVVCIAVADEVVDDADGEQSIKAKL